MKEPKRYSCGNGEGMFEDDKNGHWIEYSEHKAIVEELTEQLRQYSTMSSLPDGLDDVSKLLTTDRCLVCNGNGLVPNGFYIQTSGSWSTNSTAPETCRSCGGTGIVRC